ncbi:3-deoxy-7-phosphoheptulonate synthase [Kitasatospora sp. A2-31]|uniref:3-deoxy-7-phosphoheptulonate synthase n=1 Tax=Kitasatospora sp. A2-31 TaxID=2916414 RepID=UPI001EEB7D10|nr:3-deoxy-7-phosphoheptulonate synthase [Kitasatospora sp. A2-31]MCG6498306.1 3-deoxy-7-phosphoheptulonate synthase [Kitasatospora sp. A2-31]
MSSFPAEGSRVLADDEPLVWDLLPAAQQPDWRDHAAYRPTRRALLQAAPPVLFAETAELHRSLAEVAAGGAWLLQVGDCAESLAEQTPDHLAARLAVLDTLGDRLADRIGGRVVRVGRIGGQFAKPRSAPTELHDGAELPVFRGHLVNSEEPTPQARRHDPRRMLLAHRAGARVCEQLRRIRRERAGTDAGRPAAGPWASHEALVVDYEGPLVRPAPGGGEYLASTHLPWVGERTRQPDAAHVELLAAVRNPVACKIGPTASPADVLALCRRLDPERIPGRLTLILRFGRTEVDRVMPDLVDAVRRAGHPVVWATDPMHGNTVRATGGLKTRHLRAIAEEAAAFRRVLERRGRHTGGLHLETAATDVTECLGGNVRTETALTDRYRTLCDPRLNPEQANELIDLLFPA